jgi:hypothetical protein
MQDWTFQQTISPAETYAVEYKVNGTSSTFASDEVSHVAVSEVTTIYTTIDYYDADGKKQSQDVIASSQSTSTTCVGAANPTRWKSKLEAGSPPFAGAQLTKYSLTTYKYYVTSEGPVEAITVTEEYEPRIAFAGGLAIENYKNIDLGTGNILLRKTIVEKEQNKLADLTKQSTTIYQAWGATSAGKTVASAISGALKKVTDENIRISGTYTLVDRMSVLVCSGTEVNINIGRGLAPVIPSKLDQQNETLRNIPNSLPTNGGWSVNSPVSSPYKFQSTELDFGSDGTNSTGKYDMQFAPDSYLRPSTDAGDNGTGLNYVYVSSAAAAYEYGRAIHYNLSGMANGKSITTELRNLPSEPMGTLYLEAAGTVAKFRANGTTFAFDSQGLIAGCDAMLDGGAGLVANATGADWFPMMVPAANLPTVIPAANNTPALANTITAPSGFDPMAPGNIWASFGTAGVEGDVYAVELTRANAVGAVAESVRRESVSRSLSWLLEAPFNATPSIESLVSVSTAIGVFTAVLGPQVLAGSGSGVIANLSGLSTPLGVLAGSGSGAIANLLAATTATCNQPPFNCSTSVNPYCVTNFTDAWRCCSSITTFPLLNTSSGTNFTRAWGSCVNLTTFASINTSSGTNFTGAWEYCGRLSSFPQLNTGAGTNFSSAWSSCYGLTSFPNINTSNGTNFNFAWDGCSGLTSFPALNMSSGTNFANAWSYCTNLATFPANMFNTCASTNFSEAWIECALSQASVDNILVSINAAGQSNGTLDIWGGTSSPPSQTGAAAKTALQNRGWTVYTN